MTRVLMTILAAATFAAASSRGDAAAPTTLPTTQPATQPSTRPALVEMFHGGPGHWCQVCAAAAARKAREGRPAGDAVVPPDASSDPSGGDLITDLPPR